MEPINNVIRQRRDLFMKITNRYLGLDYDEINEKLCGRDKEAGLCCFYLQRVPG
jgi:hypothetical protein